MAGGCRAFERPTIPRAGFQRLAMRVPLAIASRAPAFVGVSWMPEERSHHRRALLQSELNIKGNRSCQESAQRVAARPRPLAGDETDFALARILREKAGVPPLFSAM